MIEKKQGRIQRTRGPDLSPQQPRKLEDFTSWMQVFPVGLLYLSEIANKNEVKSGLFLDIPDSSKNLPQMYTISENY